jgi:hypothetical protein
LLVSASVNDGSAFFAAVKVGFGVFNSIYRTFAFIVGAFHIFSFSHEEAILKWLGFVAWTALT